jgi:hypothetical protein
MFLEMERNHLPTYFDASARSRVGRRATHWDGQSSQRETRLGSADSSSNAVILKETAFVARISVKMVNSLLLLIWIAAALRP